MKLWNAVKKFPYFSKRRTPVRVPQRFTGPGKALAIDETATHRPSFSMTSRIIDGEMHVVLSLVMYPCVCVDGVWSDVNNADPVPFCVGDLETHLQEDSLLVGDIATVWKAIEKVVEAKKNHKGR